MACLQTASWQNFYFLHEKFQEIVELSSFIPLPIFAPIYHLRKSVKNWP